MPLTPFIPTDLLTSRVSIFSSTVPIAGGSRFNVAVPHRGRVIEVGCMPTSLSASNVSLAVAIGANTDSTVSNFTQIVTSTLGTFSSLQAVEGGILSVIVPGSAFVNKGDAIQFTVSGCTVGFSFYADVKRG